MDHNLDSVLGDSLPPELLASLKEAFDRKVEAVREEAEMAIREEFAQRYEHDKANLVEAMDRMLTDVAQKHEEEKAEEVAKLKEAQASLKQAVTEARSHYKAKLKEAIATSQNFVVENLAKEIKGLREQKQSFVAKQKQIAEGYESAKAALAAEQASRLAKIDEFVVKQVNRELTEFAQDRRALVETRVKLVAESKQKLAETQTRFVKEAAKKTETAINETLKREMSQLHEDLERNRQNSFGRRIFEAVAAEFMTSYLAEGTETRKLQKVLEDKDQALAAAQAKLQEAAKIAEVAARKAKIAEDRMARTKIMSELLSNLRGEKRAVMESMLETTKTEALRTTFDRLLPVVLAEGTRKAEKKVLSEARPAAEGRVVTGDQRVNRLLESASEGEGTLDNEVAQVVRLAGIQK